jgi:16S rRNA (uracil1498-N3)-methyltransferase
MSQRYFLNETDQLSTQDVHHIKHVMRMKTGDLIIVCYLDECFEAVLTVNDTVSFNRVKKLNHQKQMDITLIQGLPKGSKTESIVKTATLFGAKALILTPMERSIAKLENIEHKLKRYHLIAKEAAELSHRQTELDIKMLPHLKSIAWDTFDLILIADEDESQTSLKSALEKDYKHLKIALVIGPEGGITPHERKYYQSLKGHFIHLGELILPTEYAHIYVLSYLSAENQ